jgi:Zn-dependent M16 (insulinase) family peptidase
MFSFQYFSAWRGPQIDKMRELIALDVLFYYLTDSSISPLHAHFINIKSYCNRISYKIDEYRETCLSISFSNTQLGHLDDVRFEFFQLLTDIFETRNVPFDNNRLANIIKMKIAEIDDKVKALIRRMMI